MDRGYFYGLANFLQAAAKERNVLHDTMEVTEEKACTLRKCFQCRSGMGLSHNTRPAIRLASATALTALG